MAGVRIKMCGLRTPDDVCNAIDAGADYVGMVHCPASPRHLDLPDMNDLAGRARSRCAVAVLIDPDDTTLETLASAGCWRAFQLHGDDPPQRLERLSRRYGHIEMWKAIPISDASDVEAWRPYRQIARRILLDARAPEGSDMPGGHGRAFDWSLIADAHLPADWILAGGLKADTVAQAVRLTGAAAVDVSSGVEVRPGVKDRNTMFAFVGALRGGGGGDR